MKKHITLKKASVIFLSTLLCGSVFADYKTRFEFVCSKKSTAVCVIGTDRLLAKDKGYALNAIGAKENAKLYLHINAVSYKDYNGAKVGLATGLAVGVVAVVAGGAIAAGVGGIGGASVISGPTLVGASVGTGATATGGYTGAAGAAIGAAATGGTAAGVGAGTTATVGAATGAGVATAVAGALGAVSAGVVPSYTVGGRVGGVYLADPKTLRATTKLDGSCKRVFRKEKLNNGNRYEIYLLPHGRVLSVTVTATPKGYKNCAMFN